ncbi:MAG: hypothetical protein GVY15_04795 [Bacteroidetes bacterium]|nr:hypothetical protein [Bacteroidota bacterium]
MPPAHTISVERTAHYWTRGPLDGTASTVWMGLHGYAQRAADLLDDMAPLEAEDTLLVAPEALSRFYRRGTDGKVGASWMTSAAREDEIADYLGYLERLRDALTPSLGPEATWCVLGFSQGAATASRWAAHTEPPLGRLLLWGGTLAHDLDLAAWAAQPPVDPVELVLGNTDRYLTDERIAQEERRLTTAAVAYRIYRYNGGHALPPEVLMRVAAQSPGASPAERRC